jgi:hypothetical protein
VLSGLLEDFYSIVLIFSNMIYFNLQLFCVCTVFWSVVVDVLIWCTFVLLPLYWFYWASSVSVFAVWVYVLIFLCYFCALWYWMVVVFGCCWLCSIVLSGYSVQGSFLYCSVVKLTCFFALFCLVYCRLKTNIAVITCFSLLLFT